MDFERALLLMQVIKAAAELGPRDANSIAGLATRELAVLDDEARYELNTPADDEEAA